MEQTSDRSISAMNKKMLAVAITTAMATAGCGAAHSASAQPSVRKEIAVRTPAEKAGPAVKGILPSRLPDCKPLNIATVALIAAGTSTAVLGRLASHPAARITTSSHGSELAFFHPGATSVPRAAIFSAGPEPVPADPALQSCDYLLQDRPAAQPYITAAIDAAAARGIAASPGALRATVSAVEIGDDPLQPQTLVVLLLVEGAPSASGPNGQVMYGPNSSVFVMLNRVTKQILGAAAGTW